MKSNTQKNTPLLNYIILLESKNLYNFLNKYKVNDIILNVLKATFLFFIAYRICKRTILISF